MTLGAYPEPDEHALQKQITRYLTLALPPELVWTAVDHAAKLTPRQGRERKDRGVKPGQPDYRFILAPNGQSAEIELKTRAGRQSPDQLAWEAGVRASGGLYAVCRSVVEVYVALTSWGVRMRMRP